MRYLDETLTSKCSNFSSSLNKVMHSQQIEDGTENTTL